MKLPVLRSLSIVVALMNVSCGGGGGGSTGNAQPQAAVAPAEVSTARVTPLTDLQIAERLYVGEPRTPQDFYHEPALTSYAQVATQHIGNDDITTLAAGSTRHELCTNDWNEALSWSEATQQRLPQYSQLVATNEDPRFFEFGRVREGAPDLYLQERVFKCSYLNRNVVDLDAEEGAAGQLATLPVDTQALRQLSEYLWQFTDFNNVNRTVLTTSSSNAADGVRHSIIIARLVRGGVHPTCDRIEVIDWRHEAGSTTGTVSRRLLPLWSFGARQVNGAVELCP